MSKIYRRPKGWPGPFEDDEGAYDIIRSEYLERFLQEKYNHEEWERLREVDRKQNKSCHNCLTRHTQTENCPFYRSYLSEYIIIFPGDLKLKKAGSKCPVWR